MVVTVAKEVVVAVARDSRGMVLTVARGGRGNGGGSGRR